MSPTTATSASRPHRTVEQAIAEGDAEIMASCARVAASVRENLERLAQLPEGHRDLIDRDDDTGAVLEVHHPDAIRAVLERAWAAPAADRLEPAHQTQLSAGAQAALRQLELLGKDPARTWFRSIRHGRGANSRRRGADLQGFNAAELRADAVDGASLYFVVGNASQATSKSGAVRDQDVAEMPSLFVEWDEGTVADQLVAWQHLGLPEPTLMLTTGGKSVHAYWRLQQPVQPAAWKAATARLIAHCKSDQACSNPSRVMRLAGGAYIDKRTGLPIGTYAEIVREEPDAIYSLEQVLSCLPPPEPAAPPAAAAPLKPAAPTAGGELPPRSLEQVIEALQWIPARQPGQNQYRDRDRPAALGFIHAVIEAGGSIELAIEHLKAHHPAWPDLEQVVRSSDLSAWSSGTFWHHVKQAGGNISRHELKRSRSARAMSGAALTQADASKPGKTRGFQPRPGSTAQWGHRRRGHTDRMRCLDRCIAVQAARERNSLRRRARLRKAARDLELHSYVKDAEIAQRVLEAKASAEGCTYRPLTAADRAAMPKPVVRWLLPGLIPAGDLTIIGGRPKVGKTRLAMAITAAVLRGEAVLDLPAPTTPHPVVLVTDDQADGDTAQMLDALNIWQHHQLIWSQNFRLTEENIDGLLLTLHQNPGALVVLDSLRSIGRALQHGENDPEIGATLYDLKQAVIESGGTLLLIHHCNKAVELVGVEALSGHNAIAGAANTVVTMHYLPRSDGQPDKSIPERRLFREGRSGEGFDLVITRSPDGFRRVQSMDTFMAAAQKASKLNRLTDLQQEVRDALQASDGWMTRRQVCEAVGVPWGERGRSNEARNVGKALARLVELQAASSQRTGLEATYRIARVEHEMTGGQGGHPVIAMDLACPQPEGDKGDKDLAFEACPPCPQSEGDTENPGCDWKAPLSPLSPGGCSAPAPDQQGGTVTEWVELALGELRLAPHRMHLPEVMGWLRSQPGAPECSQRQIGDALERLHREEQASEQPDLFGQEVP